MDDCIEFQGCKDKGGYGKRRIGSKNYKAHRLAYCKAKNIDIKEIDGLVVMHTCDNPPCVNPNHLVVGTHGDNVADKVKKNRQKKGEDVKGSKLTSAHVLEIRKLVKFKTQSEVAKFFGVCNAQVCRIVSRKNWAHLPEQPSIDE